MNEILSMNILWWILFGLIVGALANAVDPRPARGGVTGAIILGILGALVGGFLTSLVLGIGITGFNLTSLVIAVLGALLVLFLQRAFFRGNV